MVRIITTLLSAAILGAIGWFGWQWLQVTVESTAVHIQASREAELGLPVYAQFVVTQTFHLPGIVRATRLVVPMTVPDRALPFTITLWWRGERVAAWQLPEVMKEPAGAEAVVDVTLPFDSPRLLDDRLELVFDGSAIAHEDGDAAPRLMVETAGERYPEGEYRIAANEKTGDVGVTIYRQELRWQQLANRFYKRPIEGIWAGGWAASLLLLAAALPPVLARSFRLL